MQTSVAPCPIIAASHSGAVAGWFTCAAPARSARIPVLNPGVEPGL
jgi:hypothetical protein